MSERKVVGHDEWTRARVELLAKEKELTRLREEVARARRDLPWERVEKPYAFETSTGRKTLAELFGPRTQLVVYHFMFDPAWNEGCPLCSFWADNFERNVVHLRHRDVTMMAISRAPLEKLEAYKKRMGWTFDWASSQPSDFNYDYQVSCTPEEIARGEMIYNYVKAKAHGEAPGISIFAKDQSGAVFHTYSCYARGLDMMNVAYQYLDLTPKGRDEAALSFPMAWVRRRDSYEDERPLVSIGKSPRG